MASTQDSRPAADAPMDDAHTRPDGTGKASHKGSSRNGGGGGGGGRRRHKGPRNQAPAAAATAAANSKKIEEEVILTVSVAATGRTPLNGWVLSLGAVAITAGTRQVLGLFSRNCQPLLPTAYVEPAADTAGYWRKQRPELQLLCTGGSDNHVPSVSVEQTMRELRGFCAPYANLTLVGSPLLGVYGWLSTYWAHAFPLSADGQAPPIMPWGFSGVCARSFASGALGVPVRKLATTAAFRDSFEGYRAVGIPVADALAAAVSYTHLSWTATPQQLQVETDTEPGRERDSSCSPPPPPPPVSFNCEVPVLLAEIGCVPESAAAATEGGIRWRRGTAFAGDTITAAANQTGGRSDDDDDEGGSNGAAATATAATTRVFPAPRSLLECAVDKATILDSFVDALDASAAVAAAAVGGDKGRVTTAHSSFREYPSITDCAYRANFLALLPPCLTQNLASNEAITTNGGGPSMEWIATEKVHGSNITIFCDGARLWAAKRTGYLRLADSSGFFDFPYLMEEARPQLMAAHRLTVEWLRETIAAGADDGKGAAPRDDPAGCGVVVAIVCEVAGGVYPHPNVPVDLRGIRVQNGVFYGPSNFLYGFDIAIELASLDGGGGGGGADLARTLSASHGTTTTTTTTTSTSSSNDDDDAGVSFAGRDGRFYLPFDDASRVFAAAGFAAYARPLHRGSLADMLALEVAFESTVAVAQLGLPAIGSIGGSGRGNPAEGYVVRPARDAWVLVPPPPPSDTTTTTTTTTHPHRRASGAGAEEDGSAAAAAEGTWARAILKRKHPRFDEFQKFNNATNLRQQQQQQQQVADGTTTPTAGVDLTLLLTTSRVESVLSKYTEGERGDTARMVAAVLADAIKDAKAMAQ